MRPVCSRPILQDSAVKKIKARGAGSIRGRVLFDKIRYSLNYSREREGQIKNLPKVADPALLALLPKEISAPPPLVGMLCCLLNTF